VLPFAFTAARIGFAQGAHQVGIQLTNIFARRNPHMAVKLNGDFAAEQKQWVKRAMKGRPLYFGLQAQAAKKGKFVVSRKPGDVKPNAVKELEVYEGDGKDKQKAADKNTIPGAASMGVCQGENGTLKLFFERGRAVPAAVQFVKYFVTREVKCKLVKRVQIAEVDQLPAVPDKDASDGQPASAASIEARVKELAQRSKAAGGDAYGVPDRLKQALTLAKSAPERADDTLDELEFAIGTLERAKALQDRLKATAGEPGVAREPVAAIAKQVAGALNLVKSGDVDGADEALDLVEQSLANLRQAAGLSETDTTAPTSTQAPQIDDEEAGAFFKDWLEGIKPDLKTLKDTKASDLPEIGEHVKAVSTALGKKDWKSATAAYKQADALITAALRRRHRGDVSRSVWTDAKNKMKSELEKLRAAIVKQSKGDEDAADIAAAADKMVAEFNKFDARLEEILEQLIDTPDGAGRDELKKAANAAIATYTAILDSPFFAMVDDNPFTKVDVAGQARQSLSIIQKTLA
jgi:hypothetical protein